MPKKSSTIECDLPRYLADGKKWRRGILDNAREVADRLPAGWDVDGPFEIVVLLYLTKGKQFQKNDVDNRLKDVLDGLQGAFSAKVKGKYREKTRVIKNDNSVCRVVIEKHAPPKIYRHCDDAPGGRLLIRPYTKHRWPLQATKGARRLRA